MKIDAGTIGYDIRPEDLGAVVADAVGRADAGDHPVTVQAEPGVRIPMDRLRFTETMVHLVENAAHFSPAPEPIVVTARREGDRAIIDVVDRGPGIAAEHRAHAFDRFAQFRPDGYQEVPGTGLGLFICRAHVHAHGGEISVEDRADGGTMLRIRLPTEGMG